MNSNDLTVITGAAQGIGLATARRLTASGYRVALLDLQEEKVNAAAKDLGPLAFAYSFDVTDAKASYALAQEIEASHGPVSGLVTCAGATRSAPAEHMTLDDWSHVLDLNVTGTFLTCQSFAQGMLRRQRGAIVTVASVTGMGGQAGRVNYAASKWAVLGMTKTLAIEWGNRGVRVNTVAPGAIDTEMFSKVPQAFREGVILDRIPLQRPGQPEEVASAIEYLLGNSSTYLNGVILPVDGGMTTGFLTHNGGSDPAA